MKRLLAIAFFILAAPAFAQESNTQIQKSTSTINSSANGGSTDVTVDNNGDVTHYTSNEGGSVSVNSANGDTTITQNGAPVSPMATKTATSPYPMSSFGKNEQKTEIKKNYKFQAIINALREKIQSIQGFLERIRL